MLLIDKPVGISSFDVIRILRRELGVRKMGHGGTLDPLASGLMIIGVGPDTKKLQNVLGLPKEYVAEIFLGAATDTGDAEGKIIMEKPVPENWKSVLPEILAAMVGDIDLPVPVYSAVKRGGQPLYKRARRGEAVEAPVKTMHVYEAEILAPELGQASNVARVRWRVGSGTYIRSLAVAVGERLGTAAHLTALRRTQIGEWRIEDAKKINL